MRLTTVLYVRQLLAKLNPSFPATARESQQLLNILDTSFRKQLDEKHPAPNQRENEDSTYRSIPLAPTVSSSNATQHYLDNLLSHPLLQAKTASYIPHSPSARRAVENYQSASIQGTITIELLQHCVGAYISGVRHREVIPDGDRLGPRLAAWLHSTTSQMKEAFFLTQPLLENALAVMAADHEERAVWNWLRMVYERDLCFEKTKVPDLTDPKWLAIEDDIVSTLMRFSIRRKDLNDAVQQFVEACEYRAASGRISIMDSFHDSATMMSSWKRLAASIILSRDQHGISPARFDAALQYGPSSTTNKLFNESVLAIYHPSNPSAQMFCINLRRNAYRTGLANAIKDSGKNMSMAILVTILDAAQLSLKHNLTLDAKVLLDCASECYADHVPTSQAKQQSGLEERIQSMWRSLNLLQTKSSHLSFS